MLIETSWRRRREVEDEAEGEAEADSEQKVRTPHKDVGITYILKKYIEFIYTYSFLNIYPIYIEYISYIYIYIQYINNIYI